MAIDSKLITAAKRVLSECLQLGDDEHLAIVCDETTIESVAALEEAAHRLNIPCRVYEVPLAEQRRHEPEDGIPIELGALLDRSRAVLTCVSGDQRCMPFRRDVLTRATTGNHKRVGHMPGITPDILATAMDVDYASIEKKCDELALALTVGATARLLTYSNEEEPKELTIGLGAWNRLGVVSSGRIPYGKWGNLPGGETFIAPVEGTANGEFWLNGSFKECIVEPGQALLLQFHRGRLTDFDGPGPLRDRFEQLIAHARDANDPDWNVLCELGIGVNHGLQALTGNPLFDEKCLGTVHIALGENTNFGGQNRSRIHEDLVTHAPSLQIDSKDILRRGQYTFRHDDWQGNIENWPVDPALSSVGSLGIARGIIAARQRSSKLRVECTISERLCSYTIGDEATSHSWLQSMRACRWRTRLISGRVGTSERKLPDNDRAALC